MYCMKFSAYDEEDKVLVYKCARKKMDNIRNDNKDGCPRYRNKYWNKIQNNCDKAKMAEHIE